MRINICVTCMKPEAECRCPQGFTDPDAVAEHFVASHLTTTERPCPFCNYEGPPAIVDDYGDVLVLEPLGPHAPGHVLVVPRKHVVDFGSDAEVSARVAFVASQLADELRPANVFTNVGSAAGQSVMHLHIHVVPRQSVAARAFHPAAFGGWRET